MAGMVSRLLARARRLSGRGAGAGQQAGAPVAFTLSSTAHLATGRGGQYLQQFCKHFAHKLPVSYDANTGLVPLHGGEVRFTADAAGLGVEVRATDAKALIETRFVVDKHLAVFAFRDKFTGLSWSDPHGESQGGPAV